jgi:hypothetical protein
LVVRRREVETEEKENGEKIVGAGQEQRLGRRETRFDVGKRGRVTKWHLADKKRK